MGSTLGEADQQVRTDIIDITCAGQRPDWQFLTYSFFPLDEFDEGVGGEDPPDDPDDDVEPEEGVEPDDDEEPALVSLDDVEDVEDELPSDVPSAFVSVVFPCGFPSSPGRLGCFNLSE
ncbi:MAG: hypothetical protein NPIRA02_24120 [Nitrospirales bacterium]|nr:MAG: hypothetical protein NPIRA02_24120 [Nitrospirales bacterium]